MCMNVVIIGSGNVATVLARKIKAANHTIVQVAGRNAEQVDILADELGCKAGDFSNIDTSADIYIIAIADGALHNIGSKLSLINRLVVHTAGAVSRDVLANVSSHYGVMYPLQSLRMERPELPEIPFLVDGNSPAALAKLMEFASTLSNNVVKSTDAERLKLHVAAVVVSNFTNHLYAHAQDFCEKEKVPFSHLQPLIEETATRMRQVMPKKLQTGPAIRNDVYTLDKHLKTLSAHPRLRYLYIKLTDSIMHKDSVAHQ
jgi:predicted short-subunit dehydrogenase-like oxidoreductase (DUF2520 family)